MKKIFLLMTFVFFSCLCISVGYAQISDYLSIQGNASYEPRSYEIEIVHAEQMSEANALEQLHACSYLGMLLNSEITLGERGDSALALSVTVRNNTVDKIFAYYDITADGDAYTNGNIVFDAYETFGGGQTIVLEPYLYTVGPSETKTFFIVFSYRDGKIPATGDLDLTSIIYIEFIELLETLPITKPPESTAESTEPSETEPSETTASASTEDPGSSEESSGSSSSSDPDTPPIDEVSENFNLITDALFEADLHDTNGEINTGGILYKSFTKNNGDRIIHCQQTNTSGGNGSKLWDDVNAVGVKSADFIVVPRMNGKTLTGIEIYFYYSEDTAGTADGSRNILVYRQILVVNTTENCFEIHGSFLGYAPLEVCVYGGNSVNSIDPEKWRPSNLP